MGFVVLAVGALMSLIGAYEIYYGNGVIAVERGWSAFIGGSVLLAGGVVTAALGLAINAIHGLRGLLPAGAAPGMRADDAAPRVAAFAPAGDMVARPDPAPARVELAAHTLAAPTAVGDEHPAPHLLALEPEPQTSRAVPEPTPVPSEHLVVDEPATEEAPIRHDHAEPILDAHWEEPAIAPPTAPEPSTAIGPVGHPPHQAPDRHPAAEPSPAAPTPSPSIEAAPDHATMAAREEPAPASPVIGRYESEGTSYVMYADGSIDAQSSAGVYRFASMAELKAFIET